MTTPAPLPLPVSAPESGLECPDCASRNVTSVLACFTWREVRYEAPVRLCRDCGLQWCDMAQQDAELTAVQAAGYVVDSKGRVIGPPPGRRPYGVAHFADE